MSKNERQELVIPNLTKLDQLELENQLKEQIRFRQLTKEDDVHGELVTTVAIVIVSLSALKVLATYLAKKTEGKTFTYKIKTRTADGGEQDIEIKYNSASSASPSAEILRQLGKATNVNIEDIGKTFTGLS